MIAQITETGLVPEFVRVDSQWGFFPRWETDAQREATETLALFSIGYPRCYATLVRIMREEGLCTIREPETANG